MRKRQENTLISIAKTLVGKKKTSLKGKIMVRIGVLYGATYFTFSVQAMFCNNLKWWSLSRLSSWGFRALSYEVSQKFKTSAGPFPFEERLIQRWSSRCVFENRTVARSITLVFFGLSAKLHCDNQINNLISNTSCISAGQLWSSKSLQWP